MKYKLQFRWSHSNPESVEVSRYGNKHRSHYDEHYCTINTTKRFIIFAWNDETGFVWVEGSTKEEALDAFVVVMKEWEDSEEGIAKDDAIKYIKEMEVDCDSSYGHALLDLETLKVRDWFNEGFICE